MPPRPRVVSGYLLQLERLFPSESLVYIGAQGGYGPAAGGGGGSSAALLAPMEGLVAGGGGGGGFTFAGGNGVPPSLDGPGGAGGGFDGGSGGIFGSPGQYGECRRPRRRYLLL